MNNIDLDSQLILSEVACNDLFVILKKIHLISLLQLPYTGNCQSQGTGHEFMHYSYVNIHSFSFILNREHFIV